jgi:hypothetical protein
MKKLSSSTNQLDKGALAMMCGKDEKPWPSVVTCWRIATACTHYKAMDTHYR